MSNLRSVFVKYPWLLRPAAALHLVLFPAIVTVQLWVDEWSLIKRDAASNWKLLRYGHDYDKH